ncbi:MAG: U32 family peptidase [Erysipelotrichaceae bacterium]
MAYELLAPAGDLERLKVAIEYGADAVYFGGKQFSLRVRASNFDLADIKAAVDYAHQRNKKVYVTVNMIPHNSDFIGLQQYLKTLQDFGVDAIICASCAIAQLAKQAANNLEVHISTQQTTTNLAAIDFWQKNGGDRVVLAREVEYDDLLAITSNTTMPIEVFIHGGMCANYSGRCVISNFLTNRDANRGGCAQSCRWNYHLYHNDELLDKADYPLSMGSKDMCVMDNFEKLLKAEVASLKIEGRMKTAYYIATVVKSYRMLIDDYLANGSISQIMLAKSKELIAKAANRATFEGFYPGKTDISAQIYENAQTANQSYVANVISCDNNVAFIEVRNYFKKGDRLRLFEPKGDDVYFTLERLYDQDGNEVEIANKPMQRLYMVLPKPVGEFTFITKSEGR